MPIRAISLDLFDTLIDLFMDRLPIVEVAWRRMPSTYGLLFERSRAWHGLAFDGFADALAAVDRELRTKHWAAGTELPTFERFRAFGARIGVEDAALAQALTLAHMGALKEQTQLHAHHPGVLASLAAERRIAVCSNFSHSPTALELLEEAKLSPHLHEIVISDAVGIRKPRPEIFDALLERLGTAAHETVHVGDNLEADIGGAAALGIRTVWITRRVSDPKATLARWTGPKPDHVISDLSELEALL